ncbi:MAG: helix-turn-helix domain-containing protein [Candidatus Gastranaerophilales bacterium]|nr:helix-turn-helix domain-containing protein [Candidatus Gastranaerophilales bacterium]
MSQYLTKEEIKQWRSSLEKITLEEYAKKLGKTIEEDKKTSDIIDIVMKNETRLYMSREKSSKQQILQVAKKSNDLQKKENLADKTSFEYIKSKLTCKKPLTQREDAVLEHFVKNKGEIVYARDLAAILDLPTDYVYKYIKNLRTKITQDILENATKGGYVFKFND